MVKAVKTRVKAAFTTNEKLKYSDGVDKFKEDEDWADELISYIAG